MDQTFVNWALGLLSAMIILTIRFLWQNISDIRMVNRDTVNKMNSGLSDLKDRVQMLELLVAGQYVKKEEFMQLKEEIKADYKSLEQKMDNFLTEITKRIGR